METSNIIDLEKSELESINGGIILIIIFVEALKGAYQEGFDEGRKNR